MKTKWIVIATVSALVGYSASVQAVPISGSVTFAGGVTLDSGSTVAGATKVTAWASPAPFIVSSGGNLSAPTFTPATFATPWTFTAATPALWSYLATDLDTFTFSLNAGSTVVFTGSGLTESVTVTGNGTITASGPVAFDPTVGTWSFTTQNPSGAGGVFSFSAASGIPTPDGGTTILLLGAALSGLGLLRRKLTA
jgi:hypothetical protein